MSLEAQEGEYGYVLALTVRDHDGSIHALTGTETIQAYAIKGGGSAIAFGTATVNDGTLGLIWVTVGSDDVATLTQGTYELRVTISGASSVLIPEPEKLEIGRGVG